MCERECYDLSLCLCDSLSLSLSEDDDVFVVRSLGVVVSVCVLERDDDGDVYA